MRAEHQRKIIGFCHNCGSKIYRDEDSGKLIFTCPEFCPDPMDEEKYRKQFEDDRSDEEKYTKGGEK